MIKSKKLENNKLHVKVGDRVVVVSGKDKGKVSSVKKALPKFNKLIVEDVNMITKAMKANPMANFQGGLVKMEAPIEAAKVMLYCSKCEKATRISYKVLEDGTKTRVCKKCDEQFDT